jgi:PAS domain S-box-containing protein
MHIFATKLKPFLHHIFVYAPGLVILVFSMLALHSSLVIMRSHEHMVLSFDEESRSLFALEEKFDRFEGALFDYLDAPEIHNPDHVKQVFTEFVTAYTDKVTSQKEFSDHSEFSEEYKRNLTEIDGFLVPVSLALQDLEAAPMTQAPRDFSSVVEPIHEKIESLIRMLAGEYISSEHQENLHSRENMLYWSVLAVGFAGFILVLLNANKLQQLKLAESERRENLKLLQRRFEALEAVFDGIGLINQHGHLTYMNAALRKLHGLNEDDAKDYIGQSWGKLYTRKGQDYIETHVMPELLEMGQWNGESPIVKKDGTIVFAELHLRKLAHEEGYIGMARNITDRKLADKTREELQGQLHQAQKMEAIGRLAGGFAHDFNNILASMNGYAEFLMDDLDPDTPQYRFANNILSAGEQARTLVDQILAFSRREKTITEMEHVNLTDCLEETLLMLAASTPKTIEIESKIADRNASVQGNVSQISQLLMNLCVNAVDAMENKHGKLKLGLHTISMSNYNFASLLIDEESGSEHTAIPRIQDVKPGHTRLFLSAPQRHANYAVLSVQDSGCGMTRAVMEHVFEPFFTTKSVDKGTGLGLSMVHAVLINHGAALMIDSIVDQGTNFQLFFPLSSCKALPDEDAHGDVIPLNGARILLVEDQEDVRLMMLSMLERIGAEAYGCASAIEAMAVIRENPDAFDLVITDQNMPKMTGFELVNLMSLEFPNLPFVLLSGYSQENLQTLMIEHRSIKAILKKPISMAALSQKLAVLLSEGHQVNKKASAV